MDSNFIPVNSSMVKEIEFNQGDNTLFVKFHNDSVYRYENITEETYKQFLNSESKGKFFIKWIKTQPCTRVGG